MAKQQCHQNFNMKHFKQQQTKSFPTTWVGQMDPTMQLSLFGSISFTRSVKARDFLVVSSNVLFGLHSLFWQASLIKSELTTSARVFVGLCLK